MTTARTFTPGRSPRNRRDTPNPDFAALRRLASTGRPNMDTFRSILDRVATNPNPVRAYDVRAYTDACHRYTELTGLVYSPPAPQR